ncbi:MAG: xanthine/uracil permease [Defluviitaleaceae bacterium]|nr:xanthine/uracil permease [Defluviitaleaceae bacterium]
MLHDLSLFAVAVIFVTVNGLTMLAWAAAQGYKMKPTAFAFLVGAVGNFITGSITPISGQSSILTVSHFMKNVNERMTALFIAVIAMVPLGLTGSVRRIAEYAGNPVIWGMMAGVGIMVAGISIDMLKQARRTGAIAFISAIATHIFFIHDHPGPSPYRNAHALVYVIAVSVTLATIDFVFLQKKRVDILQMAKDSGYTGDMSQNENPKFWTKEYWADFKLMKPKLGFNAIYFALAFICLNIGTNIAFGTATQNMGPRDDYGALLYTQNMDHLTVINSIADIPSVIFGGAPVGAIISATAAAPWPVMAGVVMMLLCMVLLLLGLMTKAVKYVPVQAIAGFLFIIGFFATFVPNIRNVFMMEGGTSHNLVEAAAAMAITALTKNPFLGLIAGVAVRYIGESFFPGTFL